MTPGKSVALAGGSLIHAGAGRRDVHTPGGSGHRLTVGQVSKGDPGTMFAGSCRTLVWGGAMF